LQAELKKPTLAAVAQDADQGEDHGAAGVLAQAQAEAAQGTHD